MKIPARILSHIIIVDRRYTAHFLNKSVQLKRVDWSKRLLSRYAGERHRNFLFTNENIFTIEEYSFKEAAQVVWKFQRRHHSASVVVW